ncbi:hypothetical protein CATYP_05185 [Corynebacterium atypicum]|uniref:Prolipoprotein LppL n=1 Tax=Corynebacterium atypicum TaxID=191610 RepID=A0ABN4DCH1_9CORY|nr:hypothetical protein [Corynebacterium atypicum]AIG64120.1 hypothetical protein CATYP_05185 [Corynebacterium atypicum]
MRTRVLALPAAVASVCALVACSSAGSADGPEPGNASPAPSAGSDAQPAGTTVAVPRGVGDVTGVASLGHMLALSGSEGVAFGTQEDFESGRPTVDPLDAACGPVTAGADGTTFVVACQDQARLYRTDALSTPELVSLGALRAQQAVLAESGEIFFGNATDAEVGIHHPDGTEETVSVEEPTDQLVAVPVASGPSGIVKAWREHTTVQDLDWTNEPPREGGRLRMGLGVGTIAPGTDGLMLASDTVGKQVAVYTVGDVIRLHQTHPTDGTPWAVAWDATNELAWVSLTDTQVLQAFKISSGVPEPAASHPAIADAQFLTALSDATLVAVSATGAGVQFISEAGAD